MRLLMGKDARPTTALPPSTPGWTRSTTPTPCCILARTARWSSCPASKTALAQTAGRTGCWAACPTSTTTASTTPAKPQLPNDAAQRHWSATWCRPCSRQAYTKGCVCLKDSLESYRQQPDADLLEDIRMQAQRLGITVDSAERRQYRPALASNGTSNGYKQWQLDNGSNSYASNGYASQAVNGHKVSDEAYITALNHELIQVEHRMIPLGLHVLGQPPSSEELVDILALVVGIPSRPGSQEEEGDATAATRSSGRWFGMGLRPTAKGSESKTRWRRNVGSSIEEIVHEAMRRFVSAPRAPQSGHEAMSTATWQRQVAFRLDSSHACGAILTTSDAHPSGARDSRSPARPGCRLYCSLAGQRCGAQ